MIDWFLVVCAAVPFLVLFLLAHGIDKGGRDR
jgi:hypothetical protein